MALLGVTYSEFDNRVGPQLKYSYPLDVLSNEAFEAYSDYVIVNKQLCEKLIVVSFEDIQFLNYSVAIENIKYERNALLFSFGFVLAKGVDTEPFGAVLQKISATFVNMEIDSEYLFQSSSKQKVQEFLKILYIQLRDKNEAFINLGVNANFLAVKLYKSPVQPRCISDYDVPIFRRDRIDLSHLPWDISFQHLIPHIDGISHVKKIIYEVGMDGDSVRRSLMLLLFHEAIIISDVFKFTNVYRLHTEYALTILSDPIVMEEMQAFSAIPTYCNNSSNAIGKSLSPSANEPTLPTKQQIVRFLLQLQPNRTLKEVVLSSARNKKVKAEKSSDMKTSGNNSKSAIENISTCCQQHNHNQVDLSHMDISRVIAFARYKGIIKRMHEYPVYLPDIAAVASTGNSNIIINNNVNLSSVVLAASSTKRINNSVSLSDSSSEDSSSNGGSCATATNNSVSGGGFLGSLSLSPSTHSGSSSNTSSSNSSAYSMNNSSFNSSATSQNANNNNADNNDSVAAATDVSSSSTVNGGMLMYMGLKGFVGMRRTSYDPSAAAAADANNSSNGVVVGNSNSTPASAGSFESSSSYMMMKHNNMMSSQQQQQQQQQKKKTVSDAEDCCSLHNGAGNNHTSNNINNIAERKQQQHQFYKLSAKNKAMSNTFVATTTTSSSVGSNNNNGNIGIVNNSILFNHHQQQQHSTNIHALHYRGGGANSSSSSRWEVKDILHMLNGKNHMDAICCRYELSYQEVTSFPGIVLIYK